LLNPQANAASGLILLPRGMIEWPQAVRARLKIGPESPGLRIYFAFAVCRQEDRWHA